MHVLDDDVDRSMISCNQSSAARCIHQHHASINSIDRYIRSSYRNRPRIWSVIRSILRSTSIDNSYIIVNILHTVYGVTSSRN